METGTEKPSYEKIYFPKRLNYEDTAEYFASKSQTNLLRKPDRGDVIDRSVEITHYQARRRLESTVNKLVDTRKAADEKRKSLDEQWNDLERNETDLRRNFIRFNQFIKENQEKKERAANKIAEQIRLRDERDSKIKEVMRKCDDVAEVKALMDKNIALYRIYENFLAEVIEKEPSMQTVNDLLKRYEALMNARRELNVIQQRDMSKLEKAKSNLKRITELYINKMNAVNNKITTLERRYDKAKLASQKWDRIRRYVTSVTTESVSDLVAVEEICRKMYLEICQRKKIEPAYTNNIEEQLFVIKRAIGEYETINKIAEQKRQDDLKNSMDVNVSAVTE